MYADPRVDKSLRWSPPKLKNAAKLKLLFQKITRLILRVSLEVITCIIIVMVIGLSG